MVAALMMVVPLLLEEVVQGGRRDVRVVPTGVLGDILLLEGETKPSDSTRKVEMIQRSFMVTSNVVVDVD